MSAGNSNVQVSIIDNGWLLTKTVNGKTTSVKYIDENKNGNIDSADKREVVSLDAGDLTTAEFDAVRKSLFEKNTETESNVGDWYKQKKTIEQEEARAEAFEKQQRLRRIEELKAQNAQLDKKKSFWGKVGTIGTTILGGISALAGFGFGFMGNSWQYNSGSLNDWNLRLMSSGVQGFEGLSTMMAANYGNQYNAANWANSGSTGSFNFDEMFSAGSADMQNYQQQFNDIMASAEKATAERKAKEDAQATANAAETLYKKYNDEENSNAISKYNKSKLNEIYQPSKEAGDYTAEDKAMLQKIAAFPMIPYDALDDNNTLDNGKLNSKLAKDVNDLVAEYMGCATDEAKVNIMAKENFSSLKSIVAKAQKGQLTEQDIALLNKILKNPKEKQS